MGAQLAYADVDPQSFKCSSGANICPAAHACPTVKPKGCPTCSDGGATEKKGVFEGVIGSTVGIVLIVLLGLAIVACYYCTKSKDEIMPGSDIVEFATLTPRSQIEMAA